MPSAVSNIMVDGTRTHDLRNYPCKEFYCSSPLLFVGQTFVTHISADVRQDAIHVYGVNHMSTKDVFSYFDLYGPDHIEWIDDSSCNVVWDDRKIVIRVMDEMSQTFAKLQKVKPEKVTNVAESGEILEIEIKQENVDENTAAAVVVPDDEIDEVSPKSVWRIAVPYSDHQLFFRAATEKDKKLPGAAQRSEYYLMYGKDPDATKEGPGLVTKSRKRKLQSQQKLVEERFKSKQPDVKIVDLAELKREGIISKMEVDEDEPVVKRLNIHDETAHPARTMHADLQEIQRRLGDRYNPSIQERLEFDDRESSDSERSTSRHLNADLRARLGGSGSNIRDRLGRRPNAESDEYTQRFEEDDDCVHDIYQAPGSVERKRTTNRTRWRSSSESESDSESRRRRSSRMKSRLGDVTTSTADSHTDLRERLRERVSPKEAVKEEVVKNEFTEEKPNLCIEIKREPEDIVMEDEDDDNFEF